MNPKYSWNIINLELNNILWKIIIFFGLNNISQTFFCYIIIEIVFQLIIDEISFYLSSSICKLGIRIVFSAISYSVPFFVGKNVYSMSSIIVSLSRVTGAFFRPYVVRRRSYYRTVARTNLRTCLWSKKNRLYDLPIEIDEQFLIVYVTMDHNMQECWSYRGWITQ